MERLILAWYAWLSRATQGAVVRLEGWADAVQLPALTVLVLGLIGVTAGASSWRDDELEPVARHDR